MPRTEVRKQVKITETSVKSQIKDYLTVRHIFSFPITQGLGSYKGAPDRIMHLRGKVVYLEIKLPTGRMSEWQLGFQQQCESDNINYYVVRTLEDLQNIVEAV